MALALVGAVMSCGEEAPPLAFAELCGAEAPVRVFELESGQEATTREIGDRLYHTVDELETEAYVVWSTGLCGEAPIRIADGVESPYTRERWPDTVLGCHEALGVVSLDPAGVMAPHPLFESDDCDPEWTDQGVVSVERPAGEDGTALLLFPYPDDPRVQTTGAIVLAEGVVNFEQAAGVVYALTPEGSLLRIDLADRSSMSVQSGVRQFTLSRDGRYLLLWMGDALNLVDTETGVTVSLGPIDDAMMFAFLEGELFAVVDIARDQQRIYSLPGLSFVDLPPGTSLAEVLDDGRWLLVDHEGGPWLRVFEPGDGTSTPLFQDVGVLVGVEEGGALVLATVQDYQAPGGPQGPMWWVPFDGSGGRLLADRATGGSERVGAARLLTLIEVGSDFAGTLALVDGGTEYRLDERVSTKWWVTSDVQPIVTYTVVGGAGAGVWRARLPAAP